MVQFKLLKKLIEKIMARKPRNTIVVAMNKRHRSAKLTNRNQKRGRDYKNSWRREWDK